MRIEKTLYPGGTSHVLTMSYDDGTEHDRRLVDLFNANGIRGTFHLNSGRLDTEGYVTAAEVSTLYRGHEVAAHTVSHPFCTRLTSEEVLEEVLEDRRALEALSGALARGMSYPYGDYDDRVIALLRACGIAYSRTTKSTGGFAFPTEPLTWHPTAHHREHILDKLEEFYTPNRWADSRLLYIWGHSYEFDREDNWDLMEEFCKRAAGRADTWYATNIEIVDYMSAQRALRVSADHRTLENPGVLDLWVRCDGAPTRIPGGGRVSL